MSARAKREENIILFLLKVRTADEVSFVNALDGADLAALSAVNALFVIDSREIVLNNDSTRGAVLFTLAAGDTAVLTVHSYLSTLVMIVAGNRNARGVANEMDNVVGAFLCAKTAADALSRVDRGNASVIYADSVTGADLDAVAVAEAGEVAEVVALVAHISRLAGPRSVVIVLLFLG